MFLNSNLIIFKFERSWLVGWLVGWLVERERERERERIAILFIGRVNMNNLPDVYLSIRIIERATQTENTYRKQFKYGLPWLLKV